MRMSEKPKKILIVEDERIIAEEIAEVVKIAGYKPLGPVKSYQQAVSAIEKEIPDIVILDIYLQSKKTGIDLAHYLQKRYRIPFLFLTAYSDKKTIEEVIAANPYGYIIKPFDERELLAGIDMAFFKHGTEQKVKQLNNALNAIRSVNQLMIREKNKDKLLQQVC